MNELALIDVHFEYNNNCTLSFQVFFPDVERVEWLNRVSHWIVWRSDTERAGHISEEPLENEIQEICGIILAWMIIVSLVIKIIFGHPYVKDSVTSFCSKWPLMNDRKNIWIVMVAYECLALTSCQPIVLLYHSPSLSSTVIIYALNELN